MSNNIFTRLARGQTYSPNDHYVAVMGVTGTGKSTFISKAIGKEVKVNEGLESCTEDVSAYEMNYRGQRVWLLDTPGFNDTTRPDIEILTNITTWLLKAHETHTKLSGLIYLHKITDNRMEGSTRTYLNCFRALCGDDNLNSTILVTTMWSKVSQQEGDMRESELISKPEFWGEMLANGSQISRHTDDSNSALEVIGRVLDRKLKVTLAVQRQMADGLPLSETGAGMEMLKELVAQRKKYETKLEEAEENTRIAIQRNQEETAQANLVLQEEFKRRLDQAEDSREKLNVTMKKLLEDQKSAFKRQLETINTDNAYRLNQFKAEVEEERRLRREDRKRQEEETARLKKEAEDAWEQSTTYSSPSPRTYSHRPEYSEGYSRPQYNSYSRGDIDDVVVVGAAGAGAAAGIGVAALAMGCVVM